MIPLAVPDLTGNERTYLNDCIDTNFVSSVGAYVDRLEKMTADICRSKYAVAVSSGTTGLHLALHGYGVCPGELVIIPSFTFIATANAVRHCGAKPWVTDISPDSWTMDAAQLERELFVKTKRIGSELIHVQSGQRIAAIVPVYTLGNIPDMKRIMKIAGTYRLPVIADAAAAVGAKYRGREIGEISDCAVLSFNGNKTVTAGGGGAIAGNDEAMMCRLRHLSTTARVNAEYDFDMVGYNYRMTNLQAAVGCAQLERVEKLVEKKRYIRRKYRELLDEVSGISFFPEAEDNTSSCWFSGIVIQNGNLNCLREICVRLKNRGIEARTFWKPVHLQKPYSDIVRADSLDVTESIWDKILTLPCSVNITDEEIYEVVGTLKENI